MKVTFGSIKQLCSMKPLKAGQGGKLSGLTAAKAAAKQASVVVTVARGTRQEGRGGFRGMTVVVAAAVGCACQ